MCESKNDSKTTVSKPSRSGLTVIELVVIVIVICVVIALLLPAVQRPRRGRRSPCKNNLHQIVIALHNYHDVFDSFPPAYIVDDDGRPLYSWRVLILPYADQQPLYDQLHLDEPWDSPHNRPLLDVEMPIFRCPSDKKETKGPRWGTNYVAVVGPETVWPTPAACRFEDVTDGDTQTILVVEVADSGIHWAEPRDVYLTQMAPEVNAAEGMGLSSPHTSGMHVAFVDGSVRFISDETPRETLCALLTRAGGETIEDDF